MKTDSLLTLHWYPNTPVGFNTIHGATLKEIFEALQEDKRKT